MSRNHSHNTVYEPFIHVKVVVVGDGILQRSCEDLICLADIVSVNFMLQFYIHKLRKASQVYLFSTVGKTCMLMSYVQNEFPENHVPTVFDNHITDVLHNGRRIQLGLWDTAGQEDYDRLRPLSYPQTDVFLVCFSVVSLTSFFNVRSKWHQEITHHCPDTPFLIVGTKTDIRDVVENDNNERTPIIRTEQGHQLANELGAVGYVECSALTQAGLNRVFQRIVTIAVDGVPAPRRRRCVIL